MNDEQIEQLLRKGPAIKTPDGLLGKLKQDIRLPRVEMGRTDWSPAPSWFRRWMPALSFAVILLGCLVAIGVQSNLLANLRRQNEALTASAQNLEALRAQNAEFQRLSRQSQELELLRKDNAELQNLRDDVAKLQTQLQEGAKLRADNQALKAAAASLAASGAGANPDFFADAKAKAESIQCVNNLKQIGLAFRIWSGDNGDHYPGDFISMTNELNSWKLLQCPSDKSHNVTNWSHVAAGNISYIRVSSGPRADEIYPYVVLVQCPIHGHILMADGSVQQGSPAIQKRLRAVDGVVELTP